MSSLAGKTGLIVGVANKRSIAWAIAQAASKAGARVALTFQGERLEENVRELAEGLTDPLVMPLDVTDDAQIARGVRGASTEPSAASISSSTAPPTRSRDDLLNPFVQTSRDGFKLAMDVSAYSLIALSRGALPLMEKQRRRQHPDAHLSRQRAVFETYSVMGVAKAALEATVRYLAA